MTLYMNLIIGKFTLLQSCDKNTVSTFCILSVGQTEKPNAGASLKRTGII